MTQHDEEQPEAQERLLCTLAGLHWDLPRMATLKQMTILGSAFTDQEMVMPVAAIVRIRSDRLAVGAGIYKT